MKKILTFFIFLLMMPIFVNALNQVEVTGSSVGIRVGPGSNYKRITQFDSGKTFDLISDELIKDEGGCAAGWYNVSYNSEYPSVYICSEFVRIIKNEVPVFDELAKTECEKELASSGFPDSYWEKLCEVKLKYPNWNFYSVQTGINFSTAVQSESSCGKNTLVTSKSEYIDSSCTKKLDSGYSPASQQAIAYYMDPRNFLDEKNIFMFESNRTNETISDDAYMLATNKIFNGNYMSTALPFLPVSINKAARETGLSHVSITSRIRNELGAGKATSDKYAGSLLSVISGEYTTRWGTLDSDGLSFDYYYNFFNVGAYDGTDVTLNALKYAKANGWGGTGNQEDDVTIAIKGGATFIMKNYTNKGQDTIYFQKFNVHPVGNSLYTHQYMTNLVAPQSEASIVYNAYKKSEMLNSSFNFYIPVFENLNQTIDNTPSGITEDVTEDTTTNTIDVETMVTNSGLNIVAGKIYNIEPGVEASTIIDAIKAQGGEASIINNNGIIGTGSILRVSNSVNSIDYPIVIKGDTSGDGKINALDLLQVQKQILGTYSLENEYNLAGDTSGDGKINALDLLQVQKHILGTYKIEQKGEN